MNRNILRYLILYFLVAYLGGLAIRSIGPIASILENITPSFLLALNALSLFAGLPLSILFDLLLFRVYGAFYLAFWPIVVALVTGVHVGLLRIFGERHALKVLMMDHDMIGKKLKGLSTFLGSGLNSVILILFVRAVPVLPFVAGSIAIAALPTRLRCVFLASLAGSYLYYCIVFLGFKFGYSLGG